MLIFLGVTLGIIVTLAVVYYIAVRIAMHMWSE